MNFPKFEIFWPKFSLSSKISIEMSAEKIRIFFALNSDKTGANKSDSLMESECHRELELVCINSSREGTLHLTSSPPM